MTAQERLAPLFAPTWTLAALAERIGDHWVAGTELAPAMRAPLLAALRDDLRTTLRQCSALVAAARHEPHALGGWHHTDEELLQAQGRLSASVVPALADGLFPHVPGLLDRLASDTAAFLDVGAGVAAVSIAMCRQYPALRAVGLEPASAPLALARSNVAAAGLRDRVELRNRRVEELADEAAFDVAWLPASFLPAATYATAPANVHRALRPGGLLLTGALDPSGDAAEAAVTRLRIVLWGGGRLSRAEVVTMIEAAGYVDVTAVERPGPARARARAPSGMIRRCTTPRRPPSPCAAWSTAIRSRRPSTSPPRSGSPTSCARARATATRWRATPTATLPRCTACCARSPPSASCTRATTAASR
jgi:predicted O-methyltransferase YrrM